jgi:uncharacterized phage-associated protein
MTIYESYNIRPESIAEWFIANVDRESGDSITPLKLQKLVYYAQSWSLVLNDKLLFNNYFEAWAHGPVLPAVYHLYKENGYNSLNVNPDYDYTIPKEVEEVLNEVNRVYGRLSAKVLEDLTHSETPWTQARGGCAPEVRCNTTLDYTVIKDFYLSMKNDA